MPEQILPPKQQKFLGCVLTARTVEQAAKAAGFSERQCYRWLADARFDAALREARRTALRLATGQLQQAAGEAVTVLRCIALDAKQPAAARVTAASKLLDAAYRAAGWSRGNAAPVQARSPAAVSWYDRPSRTFRRNQTRQPSRCAVFQAYQRASWR